MVNRGDSYANLEYYESYDLAWLGPIVFPLGLSLITIALALREGWCNGGYFNTSTNIVATLSVAVEAFFAILCFVQCVANFHNRSYVGLETACDFQGWYSTFWIYCSIGMQLVVAHVSHGVARSREQPRKASVLIMAVAVLVVAVIISLLPVMGVGYYGFLKDYCTFELHDNVMGGIFLAVYCLGLLTTSFYYLCAWRSLTSTTASNDPNADEGKEEEEVLPPTKDVETQDEPDEKSQQQTPVTTPTSSFDGPLTPGRLQIILAGLFVVIWTPTAVVVLCYQVGALTPPGTAAESAWIALSLHSQQLLVPLLVGILWRRWAQEATTTTTTSVDRANLPNSNVLDSSSMDA